MCKMPAAYYLFVVLPLVFLGFPCGSAGRESTCNAGDLGLIPGLGRSPGEGKGYPLYYSGLENSMNCIVMGSQRVGHDWETFTHLLLYYCEYKYTGWASVGSRAHSRAFPHMAGVPSVLVLPHEHRWGPCSVGGNEVIFSEGQDCGILPPQAGILQLGNNET